jgi:hypothetical protein
MLIAIRSICPAVCCFLLPRLRVGIPAAVPRPTAAVLPPVLASVAVLAAMPVCSAELRLTVMPVATVGRASAGCWAVSAFYCIAVAMSVTVAVLVPPTVCTKETINVLA